MSHTESQQEQVQRGQYAAKEPSPRKAPGELPALRENGKKECELLYNILGLDRDNGKEHGNYCIVYWVIL